MYSAVLGAMTNDSIHCQATMRVVARPQKVTKIHEAGFRVEDVSWSCNAQPKVCAGLADKHSGLQIALSFSEFDDVE